MPFVNQSPQSTSKYPEVTQSTKKYLKVPRSISEYLRVPTSTSTYLEVPQSTYKQGPTSTGYSNRTRIFLYYSNPTRKFLKNDRVASSMYSSHFRKIAALPPCCSKDKVSLSEHQMPKAEQGMKLSHSNTLFIFFQEEKLTIFCCS